jgi:hypothetical protein
MLVADTFIHVSILYIICVPQCDSMVRSFMSTIEEFLSNDFMVFDAFRLLLC